MFELPVGLALSGGIARSITHIGVVKALREARIPINYVAGTSGGSIVGAGVAADIPTGTMVELANNLGWRALTRLTLHRLGINSSKPIEKYINNILEDADFENLTRPFAVVATDLMTGKKRVFDSGPVGRAVRASCSLPQFYLPTEIDERSYIDGSMSEYLPVRAVQQFGKQFTIAVNLAPRDEHYEKPLTYFHFLLQVTSMVARQNVHDSIEAADFVVHPDVARFSPVDFGNSEAMIEVGYRATIGKTDAIRAAWKRRSHWWNRVGNSR